MMHSWLKRKFGLTAFFLVSSLLVTVSCITSIEPAVSISPDIDTDRNYLPQYEANTRKYEVIDNFETKYIISVTSLSPAFLTAFSIRYQNLYNEVEPALSEATDKMGFFISIYVADENLDDLTDQRLWTIQMENQGVLDKPLLLRQLKLKERWTPFFKTITPWSREYLLLFAGTLPNPVENQLATNSTRKLIFANSNAKVSIELR